MKQTGSVPDYCSRSNEQRTYVNWNKETLIFLFKRGLKEEVNMGALGQHWGNTLMEVQQKAHLIDQQIYLVKQVHKQQNPPPKQTSTTASRNPNKFQPKQETSKPANKPKFTPRPQLMEDQKKKQREERAKNKLCFYCGGDGHFARDCKQKPKSKNISGGELQEEGPSTTPAFEQAKDSDQ